MSKKTKEPKSGNSLTQFSFLRNNLNITNLYYITSWTFTSTPIYKLSLKKEVI